MELLKGFKNLKFPEKKKMVRLLEEHQNIVKSNGKWINQ
jgi:hypothetical protein